MNFLGVPGLSDASSHRGFVEQTRSGSIQHVDDQTQALWNRFGVTRQRTYVYIDDAGNVTVTGYGSLREDVQALLAN